MQQRLSWYRIGFIINTIVIYLFTGLVLYQVFIVKAMVNKDDVMGLTAVGIIALIYSINDFWGLNLVKRIRQNEGISRRRVAWIIVGLVLLVIMELMLAAALYSMIYTYLRYYKTTGFRITSTYTYSIYILFGLILLSGIYNFISTIRLIKKVNSNKKQFEELIQGIGTGS